jgi:3-hydroxyacyl-CoA dehydrogenase/enoyl-CoA hydratase/3-hydroxybutyryl-CoA epimerase
MINEAAGVLSDGVAASAADVDLAMIMGTGFPPFRGGLLRLADEIHPRSLVERLERYEKSCGARFTAAPLLRELARDDRGFYEAYPKILPT